jgi:hypothetical protein
MQYHKLGEPWRQSKVDEDRIVPPPNVYDPSYTVDMPLDEMSAKPISSAESAFEVYAPSGLPVTDGRSIERCRDRRDRKPSVAKLAHGEARPVDGNTLAEGEIGVIGVDPKLSTRWRFRDARDDSDFFNQSGEHGTSRRA